jgi:hypothetical protein
MLSQKRDPALLGEASLLDLGNSVLLVQLRSERSNLSQAQLFQRKSGLNCSLSQGAGVHFLNVVPV